MRGIIPQKPAAITDYTEKPKNVTQKNSSRAAKAHTKKLNIAFIASHLAVVAIILGIVAIGYRAPVAATSAPTNRSVIEEPVPSVDQIAAAEVASSVAQTANMLVADNVSNLSISLNAKTELAQTDSAFLNKPQIIGQTGKKSIIKYIAKAGDTVQSVASANGISEDTVRWANNLTSDSLTPGAEIVVPGATGVLYTVKNGDDAQSLAERYHADKDRIISFNDAELTGLKVGQQIIIPDGVLPSAERPGYHAPQTLRSPNSTSSNIAVSGAHMIISPGNGYAFGYCTYYAYNRRAELGKPIGGNWGDAVAWSAYARAAGFEVDHTPGAGAVIQNGGGWGGFGHVGVVERVNDDGSLLVSDMNYVGWNTISTRTVPASSVSSYNYIH